VKRAVISGTVIALLFTAPFATLGYFTPTSWGGHVLSGWHNAFAVAGLVVGGLSFVASLALVAVALVDWSVRR
jgi:hypothetical protein